MTVKMLGAFLILEIVQLKKKQRGEWQQKQSKKFSFIIYYLQKSIT